MLPRISRGIKPFTSVKNRRGTPFLYFHCGNAVHPLPLYLAAVVNKRILCRFNFLVVSSDENASALLARGPPSRAPVVPSVPFVLRRPLSSSIVFLAYVAFMALTRSLTNPHFARRCSRQTIIFFFHFVAM